MVCNDGINYEAVIQMIEMIHWFKILKPLLITKPLGNMEWMTH